MKSSRLQAGFSEVDRAPGLLCSDRPSWTASYAEKNNEINNTGTVCRGTQPCPFLSPLLLASACVKKNTFLPLLHPVDRANTSISLKSAGTERTRTHPHPHLLSCLLYSCTHACMHTLHTVLFRHSYSMLVSHFDLRTVWPAKWTLHYFSRYFYGYKATSRCDSVKRIKLFKSRCHFATRRWCQFIWDASLRAMGRVVWGQSASDEHKQRFLLEIWRDIKRDRGMWCCLDFLGSGACVVFIFSFEQYLSTMSSNWKKKQHKIKSLRCSIWKKTSAPQAWHEKKTIQNRPAHKSLALVDRGGRLLGAEHAAQQTGRQVDSRHAHPDCLWWTALFWRGAPHRETKAFRAMKQRPSISNI